MKKKARTSYRSILLASHGTRGARAAEKLALAQCTRGTRLHHLLVVPDFWKGMMGDDWLNNASTRDVFGKYVETSLEGEALKQAARLQREAERRGIRYEFELAFGKPSECLLERLKRKRPDIVVIGAPRPKRQTGLRSRLITDELLRGLRIPVLIAPHPQ